VLPDTRLPLTCLNRVSRVFRYWDFLKNRDMVDTLKRAPHTTLRPKGLPAVALKDFFRSLQRIIADESEQEMNREHWLQGQEHDEK
jgi:hypothetical protein